MARIDRWADLVGAQRGWRSWFLAIFLGAFATLSLPPVSALPALIFALSILVWQLDHESRPGRARFFLGWCFGFGYFAVGLYWIGNALLVFGDQHAWMLPFAALGLPAFLALFTGTATCIAGFAAGRFATILALAVMFASMDWLRGHILTGLPWNLFGHAWTGNDALLQSASLYGIYGVGLWALIAALLPAAVAGGSLAARLTSVGMAVVIIAGHWAYGANRSSDAVRDSFAGVGIRLVQANIPQREKWARQYRARNIKAHFDLSQQDRPDWITHIVWPEMAATFYLAEDATARRVLSRVIPQGGLLITGAPRHGAVAGRSHNSVLAMESSGNIVGHYDKSHLVPFGEYVPLASFLPIEKLTQGALGYAPGVGVRTLRLPGLPPVSLLVCYEIIFPGAVVDPTDRPAAIFNLTNDAWYGVSAGPYQHLANARVRAVEEGIPVVRAAYTGISGAFDSYGRSLGLIPLNQRGFLDLKLPRPFSGLTAYAQFGDQIFLGLLLIAGFAAVLISRRAKSSPDG